MQLLYITPEYPPCSGGGIATFYHHLLPTLARQGHDVRVLVANALMDPFPPYRDQGIQVDCIDQQEIAALLPYFSHYSGMPYLQRYLATAWAAWEQTRGGQGFDRVETTDWGLLFIPWVVAAERPPSVVQCHASLGQIDRYDPQSGQELQGHLIRLIEAGGLAIADEVQTYSRMNQRDWEALLHRPVSLISPAFSPESFPPLASVPTMPLGQGLVVGRIQQWKGPLVLCEALQLLGDQAPTLTWVGRDTPYRVAHQSMSTYLKTHYPRIWGKQVQAIGPQPPAIVAQMQAQADFIVVPSTWDVFNLSGVEGMAQGKVVICSKGAGLADLIEPDVNGFLFAPGDSSALADCLRSYQQLSASARQRMGKAAQETIYTRLNPEMIAQRRYELYGKLSQHNSLTSAKPPSEWLINAVSPAPSLTRSDAFLDNFPLRQLIGYCGQRLLQKGLSKVL